MLLQVLQNNEVAITVLAAAVILLIVVIFFICASILYNNRQRNHQIEIIELKNTYNQTLLQAQLEMQEQTFQNISQEIHDNIGQVLSLAKLNLNTMPPDLPQQISDKIIRSKDLVSKAIIDLRDLSKILNTELIKEIGLNEIIQREMLVISKTDHYETNFSLEGSPIRFDQQKELILFRILQELINNIIKHANAKKIDVQLQYVTDAVKLKISDDGNGFDAALLESKDNHFGLGLRNMKNRAALIGADFNLVTSPGAGTNVEITLAIQSPAS